MICFSPPPRHEFRLKETFPYGLVRVRPEVAGLEHGMSLAALPTLFHKLMSIFWACVGTDCFAKEKIQIFQRFPLHTQYKSYTSFFNRPPKFGLQHNNFPQAQTSQPVYTE